MDFWLNKNKHYFIWMMKSSIWTKSGHMNFLSSSKSISLKLVENLFFSIKCWIMFFLRKRRKLIIFFQFFSCSVNPFIEKWEECFQTKKKINFDKRNKRIHFFSKLNLHTKHLSQSDVVPILYSSFSIGFFISEFHKWNLQ